MNKDYDVSDLFEHNYEVKKTRKDRKLEKKQQELDKNKKILEENERKLEYKKIEVPIDTKESKKIKENKIIPEKIERTQYKDLKVNDLKENKKEKVELKKEHHVMSFLYNAFFSFITILLFLTSIGNILYTYYYNKSNNNLINAGIIISISLFYMLNAFIKKDGAKKFFGILTSISIMAFVSFNLFIA